MHILAIVAGVFLMFAVLLDAFETVVLPRRVRGQFRLTTWFYRNTWRPWTWLGRRIRSQPRRESFFAYFGPLSLIFLLALWALSLIFAFTLLQYGTGGHLRLGDDSITFWVLLYHSGETFFTLGYGDIVPSTGPARFLAVLEAGMGFAFLGTVIGYLPTIYSAFSRREIEISLLDERAGSPPTAAELLYRYGGCPDVLAGTFRDWERWSAEVLESHISYPVLSFFRSQHNNQSWLSALTTILDATSLVIAGVDGIQPDQAKMTFAIARHAVVDLAQVVRSRYIPDTPDRLPPEMMLHLRQGLSEHGLKLREGAAAEEKLSHLRAMYEPYVQAMAENLSISLPAWISSEKRRDNWQAGPWDRVIQARGLGHLSHVQVDEHF